MGALTVKLPPALAARFAALVRQRKQSKSELAREAIERLLEQPSAHAKGSVLDLAGDVVGAEAGPRGLSSNPKHMSGYGKK